MSLIHKCLIHVKVASIIENVMTNDKHICVVLIDDLLPFTISFLFGVVLNSDHRNDGGGGGEHVQRNKGIRVASFLGKFQCTRTLTLCDWVKLMRWNTRELRDMGGLEFLIDFCSFSLLLWVTDEAIKRSERGGVPEASSLNRAACCHRQHFLRKLLIKNRRELYCGDFLEMPHTRKGSYDEC
jgi:hypothetical protein